MTDTTLQNGVGHTRGFAFSSGPLVDKRLYPTFYFIRDLLWIIILSIPLYLQTIFRVFIPRTQKEVKGKVVVITGSANGMGRELAIRFAKLGSKVACVDINKAGNEATLKEVSLATRSSDMAKSYTCDLADADAVNKLADDIWKEYGRIDILIHNAALLCGHDFLEAEDKIIRRILDVNLVASFWVLRAFLRHMKKRKEGHVVVTSSVASTHPLEYFTSYCAAKSGILGLVDTLDVEMKNNPDTKNIKFTTIHPFFVITHDSFLKFSQVRFHLGIQPSEAAKLIIVGIRREYKHFTIPWLRTGFFFMILARFTVPNKVYNLYKSFIGGIEMPKGVPYIPPPSDLYVPDETLSSYKKVQ